MYIAELKGKLPTPLSNSKDILVSNVFSFFKYADREVFLNAFLRSLGINLSGKELKESEFIFWPSYGDNTSPDLIILAGDSFIVIQAKYLPNFEPEPEKYKAQLMKDMEYRLLEAKLRDKEFLLVMITDNYNYVKNKEIKVTENLSYQCKWINWQTISEQLFRILETEGPRLTDYLFAKDLYHLMEKKGLRNFRSFHEIDSKPLAFDDDEIFFSAKSARYRGSFIGFENLTWRKVNGDN